MTVANTLEKFLKTKGLSKKSVADAIEMPISTMTTKMKNNTFTAEELILISQVLGLDLSSFNEKATGNMLLTIKDKTKEVPSINKNISSGICAFQIRSGEGDGIYIIGASPHGSSYEILSIEDFNIRGELVYRIRSIEKIHQFTYFGFDQVETEDIPVKTLVKSLLEKRGINKNPTQYLQEMAIRFMEDIQ